MGDQNEFGEKIDDKEFLDWIREQKGKFRFVVYQGMEAMEQSIESLDLNVRTYNCLKRAGYETINSVVNDIKDENDLLTVRNMGRKSAHDFMEKLFFFTYENLDPGKRKAYLSKVKSMN